MNAKKVGGKGRLKRHLVHFGPVTGKYKNRYGQIRRNPEMRGYYSNLIFDNPKIKLKEAIDKTLGHFGKKW